MAKCKALTGSAVKVAVVLCSNADVARRRVSFAEIAMCYVDCLQPF